MIKERKFLLTDAALDRDENLALNTSALKVVNISLSKQSETRLIAFAKRHPACIYDGTTLSDMKEYKRYLSPKRLIDSHSYLLESCSIAYVTRALTFFIKTFATGWGTGQEMLFARGKERVWVYVSGRIITIRPKQLEYESKFSDFFVKALALGLQEEVN